MLYPTSILVTSVKTADLHTTIFLAQQPITSLLDGNARKRGLVIADQYITDLMVGHTSDNPWIAPLRLFVMRGRRREREIPLSNRETPVMTAGVSLSPNGRYALILTNTYLSG